MALLILRNWPGSIAANIFSEDEKFEFKKDDLDTIKDMVRFPKATVLGSGKRDLIENITNPRNIDQNIINTGKEMTAKIKS